MDVRPDLNSHGPIKHSQPALGGARIRQYYLQAINDAYVVEKDGVMFSNCLFNNLNTSRNTSFTLDPKKALTQIVTSVNNNSTVNVPRHLQQIGQAVYDNTAEMLFHSYMFNKFQHRFDPMLDF